MFTTCINYQCIHIKTKQKYLNEKRERGGRESTRGRESEWESNTEWLTERERKSRRKGTEVCTKVCSNFCLCFSHKELTFLTRVSMLLEKKGGSRAAIWYRMQPSAHTSAFSPYGWFCTISGLQRSNTALVMMASRKCSKKIQHSPPQVWDCKLPSDVQQQTTKPSVPDKVLFKRNSSMLSLWPSEHCTTCEHDTQFQINDLVSFLFCKIAAVHIHTKHFSSEHFLKQYPENTKCELIQNGLWSKPPGAQIPQSTTTYERSKCKWLHTDPLFIPRSGNR